MPTALTSVCSAPPPPIARPATLPPTGDFCTASEHLQQRRVGNGIAVETSNEGKIVIAGTCGTSALELCITKLNRDGTFDADFRGDSLPVGQGGRVRILTTDESGNAVKQRAADIKMQADGRFLVQCGYFRTSSWSQCLYRINSDGTVATSFSSGLPFPSEPGRVVYNAIGDALAFTITPGSGTYANRVVTLGNCDGVGGNTGGTSCVTAVRNGTGPASADGTIDTSLVGPNGDQLEHSTFVRAAYHCATTIPAKLWPTRMAISTSWANATDKCASTNFARTAHSTLAPALLMSTQMDVSLLRPTVWQLFAICWACRSR